MIFRQEQREEPRGVDLIGRDSFSAMSGWVGENLQVVPCVYAPVKYIWRHPRPSNAALYSDITLRPPTSPALYYVPDDGGSYTFSDFSNFILSQHVPSFAYHVLTRALNPDTWLQPAVRQEWDCWLVRISDGDICVGLIRRLYWDLSYTIYAAVRYKSPQCRHRVVQTGMLVIPTSNVWIEQKDEEEDEVEGFWVHPEFNRWRNAILREAHMEVQLTFEYGHAPPNVLADALLGCPIFHHEL